MFKPSLPDQEEMGDRGLVIPDNRAIKNLKGGSEAKSKSFPGLRRRKNCADLSLFCFQDSNVADF